MGVLLFHVCVSPLQTLGVRQWACHGLTRVVFVDMRGCVASVSVCGSIRGLSEQSEGFLEAESGARCGEGFAEVGCAHQAKGFEGK